MAETTYHELMRRGSAPGGVYVFADRERMNPVQRALASDLWNQLSAAGPAVRLLNNPARQLGRYELLRKLHEEGINEFNVYRPCELSTDLRYPVFVRKENDHAGPRSDLIRSQADLHRALAGLALAGVPTRNMLVTEYVETASPDGIYRKYGAFSVGDRIFGQHLLHGSSWNNKHDTRLRTPVSLEENRAYFVENPHAEILMPYFEMAHIDYGRIDYSFKDGRIQIWEINDNPFFAGPNPTMFNQEKKERVYLAALDSVSEGMPPSKPIPIATPNVWEAVGTSETHGRQGAAQ